MTKVFNIQSKGSGKNIKVEAATVANEVFADGAAAVHLGFPNTRIIFTSQDVDEPGSDTKDDIRREVLRLVIPTNTLLELCGIIYNAANNHRDLLIGSSKEQIELLEKHLSNIIVTKLPKEKH